MKTTLRRFVCTEYIQGEVEYVTITFESSKMFRHSLWRILMFFAIIGRGRCPHKTPKPGQSTVISSSAASTQTLPPTSNTYVSTARSSLTSTSSVNGNISTTGSTLTSTTSVNGNISTTGSTLTSTTSVNGNISTTGSDLTSTSSVNGNITSRKNSRPIFLIPCLCGIKMPRNLTISEFMNNVLTEMTVDSKNTTANRLKYTSADDPRPSAKAVGIFGVTILLGVGLFIIICDLSYILSTKPLKKKRSTK